MDDILKYLQRHGFTAVQAGAVITVKDPVYRCGTGGALIPCGFKPVSISDWPTARQFVPERN